MTTPVRRSRRLPSSGGSSVGARGALAPLPPWNPWSPPKAPPKNFCHGSMEEEGLDAGQGLEFEDDLFCVRGWPANRFLQAGLDPWSKVMAQGVKVTR